ncbi:ABC transporter permease [Actinopolymorpha pittospori]
MTALVGTGKLVRLILRRDRFILPVWLLLLVVVPISYVSATEAAYPTAAGRLQYATTSGTNPTFLALYGPLYDPSIGGLVAQRAGFVPIVLGLISLLMVIRHTRTEEEAGRRELLGATVLGRQAGLAAALIVAFGANLLLALLLGLGMMSQNLPAAGSFAFAVSFAMSGCVFAVVGGLAAQLTEGAGAARGIALGALGVAFVLRVAGDIGGEGSGAAWLSWLSPIGWSHAIRAYDDERWWVIALAAGLAVVLAVAAAALSARRDLGAGLLPPSLGPAEASPALRSPFALAWRLHRGLLLGWSIGLAALGLVFGSIAYGVRDILTDNPQLEEMFARLGGSSGLVDATLAGTMGFVGVAAAGYAVQATLRLRSEETAMRAEPVLGTAVSRYRWAASHLVFALLGPTVALAVAGLMAGLAHGLNAGDVGGQLPRVFAGAMVQLPAVWILAGIALALFGLVPRIAAASWGALALFFLLGQVGALLDLPQGVLDVSPFSHLPQVPGGDVSAAPMLWLTAIAVVLVAAGVAGFRRRDVPVS